MINIFNSYFKLKSQYIKLLNMIKSIKNNTTYKIYSEFIKKINPKF